MLSSVLSYETDVSSADLVAKSSPSDAAPRIFVDGDACPAVCMDILIRAAMRREIHLLRVANHFLRLPDSPYLSNIIVPCKEQAADIRIKKSLLPDDVLIAKDFRLIGVSVRKCSFAIDPTGYVYTSENTAFIPSWKSLYTSDLYTSGWAADKPYTKKDRIKFANSLDRVLTRVLRRRVTDMCTVANF